MRTGRNGRVLLVRGKETILVSPNSVMGISAENRSGLSTTITQQAGSILLEVEKRNENHFQVETPYLAAVVKGTQFRVTVDKSDTQVDVLRGQVEVSDFKSGQFALVLPGQTAKVSPQEAAGLLLSGSGTLSPVQSGSPRASSLTPMQISEDRRVVADSEPNGRQTRSLSPRGGVESAPARARGGSDNESFWSSALDRLSKFFGFGADRGNRNNTGFNLAMAVPLGIGLVVSAAVAAQRRRKRQK